MSKTDTVARFILIFARKVHFLESSVRDKFHFLENSSFRDKFCSKVAEASPLLKVTTP